MSPAVHLGLLLVHGDERHLVDREARAWLAQAREHCLSDLNIEIIEAPSKLDQVRRSLAEAPFLDDRRHLLIRDAPQLGDRSRRGADGPDVLAAALGDRSPTTSVCLVAHQTVAPTNPIIRAVSALGGRVSLHTALRGRELREWTEGAVRQRGLKLRRGGYDHLLQAVGPDLGRLETEIDKLVAYADGRPDLGDDEVRILVGQSDQLQVWDIVERLLGPQPARGAAAIDALLSEGASPQHLISILAGQFRELLQAAELLRGRGGGAAALARELRLPPWRAERLMRWASAVPPETSEAWLRALQRLDTASKQGLAADADGLRAFALGAAGEVSAAHLA